MHLQPVSCCAMRKCSTCLGLVDMTDLCCNARRLPSNGADLDQRLGGASAVQDSWLTSIHLHATDRSHSSDILVTPPVGAVFDKLKVGMSSADDLLRLGVASESAAPARALSLNVAHHPVPGNEFTSVWYIPCCCVLWWHSCRVSISALSPKCAQYMCL